jgi:uncharacterized membrane protein
MISFGDKKQKILFLSLAGFVLAVLTGVSEHSPWLKFLCGFSNGCSETLQYTILSLPAWLWGAVFYASFALLVYFTRYSLLFLMAIAFGVELRLLWIMVSIKAFCGFCVINFVVMLLLFVLFLERSRVWKMLAVSLISFQLAAFLVPLKNQALSDAAVQHDPQIVATVESEVITAEQLDGPLNSAIYKLQMEIYRLRQRRLDELIAETLFRGEAQRRGVPVDQVLKETMLFATMDVTEEEIGRYLSDNQDKLMNWTGSEAQLREQVKDLLQQQKAYQKAMD